MKVKTKAAMNALEGLAEWIQTVEPYEDLKTNQNRAVNTVIGCYNIVSRSPTTNIRAWIDRKPHRKALKTASKAIKTKSGRRAIAELIRLTLSELEASRGFRPDVEVGPLPVREPRQLSEAQVIALRRHNDEKAESARRRIA